MATYIHLAVLVAALILTSAPGASARCRRARPLTPFFCTNPPVAAGFEAQAYMGRWFQIFKTVGADIFQSNRCVTARYTLQQDGSIAVLNCDFPEGLSRPRCVEVTAVQRQGGRPGQLLLQAGGRTGSYNVAALLGRANYGYFGAAVSSCTVTPAGPVQNFFILTRVPFSPNFVLRALKKKLRCKGYRFGKRFDRTKALPTCKYYFGSDGFDIISFGNLNPST